MEPIPRIEKLIKDLKDEPQQIDGYTLQCRVGGGAFAHVFEATCDRFGNIKSDFCYLGS